MNNTWDKCKNCGGDYGIHHYETLQCPFGGVEAGSNFKQIWTASRFEKEDNLAERVERLEKLVASLLEAVPQAAR